MVLGFWRILSAACGLVALACGGQSVKHVADGSGGEPGAGATTQSGGTRPTSAGGGSAAGGEPSTGGTATSIGGATTSTAGTATSVGGATTSTGGTATSTLPPPDFDFTPEPNAAVTYLIDPAHSSAQMGATIRPPFERSWQLTYAGVVSYPLIVGERIFFTSADANAHDPTVHAMDRAGAEAWQATPFGTGMYTTPAYLAYDRGLVFVVDWGGHVVALDAETGAEVWATTLDARALSAPVAAGGAVFVTGSSGGRELFALHEQDGSLLYRTPSQGGHPTLGATSVYTTSDCNLTSAVFASTGGQQWRYVGTCAGGGTGLASLWGGYLFASDGMGTASVISARVGTEYTTLELQQEGMFWPMTFGRTPLAFTPKALVGYDQTLQTKRTLVPLAGTWPRVPAVATPEYILALLGPRNDEPANLVALDPDAGTVAWRDDDVTFPPDPDFSGAGLSPLPGMAVGAGYIAVGLERTVAVFESLDLQ